MACRLRRQLACPPYALGQGGRQKLEPQPGPPLHRLSSRCGQSGCHNAGSAAGSGCNPGQQAAPPQQGASCMTRTAGLAAGANAGGSPVRCITATSTNLFSLLIKHLASRKPLLPRPLSTARMRAFGATQALLLALACISARVLASNPSQRVRASGPRDGSKNTKACGRSARCFHMNGCL